MTVAGSHINFQQSVPFPAALFEQTLEYVLGEIAAQRGLWRDFVLHLNFGDFGLPNVGYIAIPIRLTSKPETIVSSAQKQISLHIEGMGHPEAFPIFTGSCGVEAIEPSHSTVWLNGDYALPLEQQVLAAIGPRDVQTLNRQAHKALENFLVDIITACDVKINKSEMEYTRYHNVWQRS